MLTMMIKRIDDNEVVYTYFPEGKGASGEVRYNFNTNEYQIEKSDDDKNQRYGLHAIGKLREYVKNNSFSDKALVAWC